jgi:hypothetical protein
MGRTECYLRISGGVEVFDLDESQKFIGNFIYKDSIFYLNVDAFRTPDGTWILGIRGPDSDYTIPPFSKYPPLPFYEVAVRDAVEWFYDNRDHTGGPAYPPP